MKAQPPVNLSSSAMDPEPDGRREEQLHPDKEDDRAGRDEGPRRQQGETNVPDTRTANTVHQWVGPPLVRPSVSRTTKAVPHTHAAIR
jgi:hypothetical protein